MRQPAVQQLPVDGQASLPSKMPLGLGMCCGLRLQVIEVLAGWAPCCDAEKTIVYPFQ